MRFNTSRTRLWVGSLVVTTGISTLAFGVANASQPAPQNSPGLTSVTAAESALSTPAPTPTPAPAPAAPATQAAAPAPAPAPKSTPTPAPRRTVAPRPVVAAAPAAPAAQTGPVIGKVIQIVQETAAGDAAQAATNACIGPIEYRWGNIPPIIVQHNFCGGTAMVNVSFGETVQIIGGDVAGLYQVTSRNITANTGLITDFLPSWGDVLLTTCINSTQEVAVGLTRIG